MLLNRGLKKAVDIDSQQEAVKQESKVTNKKANPLVSSLFKPAQMVRHETTVTRLKTPVQYGEQRYSIGISDLGA